MVANEIGNNHFGRGATSISCCYVKAEFKLIQPVRHARKAFAF